MAKHRTIQQLVFQQQMLIVLLFTFAAIVMWIGSTILFSYNSTTLTDNEQMTVTPLDPKIDTTVLDMLEKRRQISPDDLTNIPKVAVESAPETAVLTVVASASATPLPEASVSATPTSP